ncbi:hypothetical protein L208DRAFT_1377471 [Tricholoma matsutake]|nr:hypothetical protein L208DRAFT_1377471 [Tricholoma matsutake 945]
MRRQTELIKMDRDKHDAMLIPIHPEWGAAHSIAVQEHQSIKSLKIQPQEMQAEKKKYVMLIVWHKNGMKPLWMKLYVDTFPQLWLSASSDLMDRLSLTTTSWIDLWEGEWTTVRMKDPLDVIHGQQLLLHLCRSLLKELTDCPGLDNEANELQRCHLHKAWAGSTLHLLLHDCLLPNSWGHEACRKPKTIAWPHNFYVCDISTGMAKLDKLCVKGIGREKAFCTSFPSKVQQNHSLEVLKAME